MIDCVKRSLLTPFKTKPLITTILATLLMRLGNRSYLPLGNAKFIDGQTQ